MTRTGAALLVAGLFTTVSGHAQSGYTFVQIDSSFSPVSDINDNGVAVGFWTGRPDGSLGFTWTRANGAEAILSDPATVNRFPSLTAGGVAAGLRINTTGTIAGAGCLNGCGVSGYQAARVTEDTLQFLGTFSGDSSARGINDSDVIVGAAWGGGFNNFGPFIWTEESGIGPLAGFNGVNGGAVDINNLGQVAGTKSTGTADLAFLWSASSGLTDIPPLPTAFTSQGFAVNDFGVVVGRAFMPGDAFALFRWSSSTGTENLSAPAGLPETIDINNAGDIVATINTGAGGRMPYLFRGGTWTNINDLLPAGTEFAVQFVTAINNRGWIVGAGTSAPPTELGQGFVLIPPNSPPVAVEGSIETDLNTPVAGAASASDEDNDPLTYHIVQNGTKGTATFTDATTGAFEYFPHPDQFGSDSFSFRANDGIDDSNIATISVTITASCAANVTANATISLGGDRFDKRANRFTQKVTLRGGTTAIQGPLYLVLDDLTAGVTVLEAAGETGCAVPLGSPYVTIDLGSDGTLTNRERVSVELTFSAPTGTSISYTPRLLAGPAER